MVKKNQNHFIEGIARWNDFIQVHCVETGFFKVNPGKLIWLMEKLWKLTSSIEKTYQPVSSISNLSKSLSTIKKQGKSLSSVRNPIAQFSLEKRSCKHFVDMFSLKKFLLTKFVWKLYEHPSKTSVIWLEARTLHFYSIGSPSKTNLFMENQGKLFQGQKTQKMQSLKRKHSKFFFIEKKTVWIDFIQKDSCKKINEKNNEVKLNYWGTQENKLSAMVTPWGKKCYLEIHWNQFHYWKSQKLFSFKRNPPKRTSFTEKPRKLISPKEKSKKSTLTTRIQKKLFSRLENRKKRVFIFLQDLENKICWWENHATSLFWKFSWKSVSWWKIPWKLFWFKKFHGNQFRWFQKDQIEFVNEKFREVCSAEIDSMKTAFINGETRTNTISLTGTPDEPISYKCNARKLVFWKKIHQFHP